MRPTVLEVDLKKIEANINNIKQYVGNKKIMPIIKANGYGTYINKNIDFLNKFDIVAVAIVDEAIELRNIGYKKEIFVLNPPYIEEIEEIIKYDITVCLCEKTFLKNLSNINDKIKVHLEIETGMNRTGINLSDLNEFINLIKENKNIIVEGIFTHLSSADYDIKYTKKQLEKFNKSVNIIKKEFNSIKYIHAEASNGLLNYNDNITNLVRPGIIMYGYEASRYTNEKIHIEPICKLKTKIVFIKKVSKGESISYSRKFISEKNMRIATIPIGYADGLNRLLSNKGEVVINNKKCKILGNICMDSCMVDITDLENVEIGTDVYIWDNNLIKVEDVAKICNTINYEILSNISYRVIRKFK